MAWVCLQINSSSLIWLATSFIYYIVKQINKWNPMPWCLLGDGTVGGGENRCKGERVPIWPTSKGGKNEKSKTEEFSEKKWAPPNQSVPKWSQIRDPDHHVWSSSRDMTFQKLIQTTSTCNPSLPEYSQHIFLITHALLLTSFITILPSKTFLKGDQWVKK